MITYAQHCEDILLARCFQHQATGFYVDIGAWHPTHNSVTNHFYLHGWQGINVEPNLEMIELLRCARDRDINIHCGVSDYIGRAIFRELSSSALSTLTSKHIPSLKLKGCDVVREYEVQVVTLSHLFDSHVDQEVDFMKIDVEGLEKQVIVGGDWNRHRPQVVVVESTAPQTEVPCWMDWEPNLVRCGYRFAHFDGLNRYYVRQESCGLLTRFR